MIQYDEILELQIQAWKTSDKHCLGLDNTLQI